MENEVQDNQYDQRDAEKPAEKVRHDGISFRVEVSVRSYLSIRRAWPFEF
jgi:hypothetical protein